MSKDTKYLKIVNASAGSGKTYSLVKTFIRLLLSDKSENANSKYAEILAMTFTNKAAIEMKTRILKGLDMLAYPELNGNDYLNTISIDTGLKREIVQLRAQYFLSQILHHYEDFHVMTIDKFNLRLIRSFSRDLDLPPDFEVILNEKPILEQVVDDILGEIGKDKFLTNILLQYANANIEDEKKWDLRKSLIDFATILTREQDLPYVERLMNIDFSVEEYNKHWAEVSRLNKAYQKRADDLVAFFNKCGFIDKDFSNGRHIVSSINKLATGNLKLGSKDAPFSVSVIGNIEKAVEKGELFAEFNTKVTEFVSWYTNNNEEAAILVIFLKNYFNMALLKHLNHALLAMNKQERLIRISEFNTKIAQLLQEDTLYIYEKLGTRFRHFMLDEFQDTSRLQWLNLIPLIRESLGHGNENFIVGDSKQAIYRFKNGVAEQFVELPGIYNPENNPEIAEISTYFNQMGEVENLEDNWRSSPVIVDFNNDLFKQLSNKLNDYQRKFYSSISQTPMSKKKGYVYIESLPSGADNNEDKQSNHLNFVLESVNDALNDGFKPGDICVLGRNNRLCNYLAASLTEEGFSVVSADSLNIDSELTVRFIIAYFKLRLNSANQNIIRQFVYVYCELFNYSLEDYNSFFKVVGNDEKQLKIANLDLFLLKYPEYKEGIFQPFETLYDLIQKTYRLFGLDELKNPYLHHLADLVYLYESKNGPDLNLFIQDYESLSKEAKALQIPESDEALKIMTIHKAKGLEFPVVIVINEMSTRVASRNQFVETDNYLLHSSLSGSSPVEEIRLATEEEQGKSYLDNLNLYYVAYTRPTTRLYIKNEYDKSGLSNDLHQALSLMDGTDQGEELKFIRGDKRPKEITDKPDESSEDVFFIPKPSKDNLWFPDLALQDKEELKTGDYLSDEQRYGNQFHLAISSIHKLTEIDEVVEKLVLSGEIEQPFEEQLKQDLNQLFTTQEYNQLFDDALEILSEQSYIISKNEQIRPDKIILKKDRTIVLDYKTGHPMKRYTKQVNEYCSVLEEMNFPRVEGYLFYTKDYQLEKVKE